MLTYTGRRNLYGTLTNNDSAANLTLGDTLMNESERHILALRNWAFLRKTGTDTTVASQQFYELPTDSNLLENVYITSGSTQYIPRLAPSRQFWDRLNSTSNTSDTPEWFILLDDTLGFYPTPASSGNTITYTYRKKLADLSQADFTTGTVEIITNGAVNVLGSGTSWVSEFSGRYMKIDPSNTPGASGDNRWYEILTVLSSTTFNLVKKYQGASVNVSSTYTIGEISLIPEDYQIIPVYSAIEIYYTSIQPEPGRAQLYKRLKDEKTADLIQAYSRSTSDPLIENDDLIMTNPNLFVQF